MLLSKEIFSWGEEKESKLDREALMKCDVFFSCLLQIVVRMSLRRNSWRYIKALIAPSKRGNIQTDQASERKADVETIDCPM